MADEKEKEAPKPVLDKEGLKARVFSASRLSNEDKAVLIDLVNRA